jgi:hypothetical protein
VEEGLVTGCSKNIYSPQRNGVHGEKPRTLRAVAQMVLRCDQIGTDLFTAQDLFPDHSKSRSIAGSKLIRLRRIQTVEPAGMEFILSLAKGCDKNGDPEKRYSLVQSPVLSLIKCLIRGQALYSLCTLCLCGSSGFIKFLHLNVPNQIWDKLLSRLSKP